jgi:tetratricopeptide (TPR) repeat protein
MRSIFTIVVTLLAAIPAGAVGRPAAGTPEIPQKLPPGFLVLPFENNSNLKSLEWMRVALPVALAEKLEAHGGLRLASTTDTIVPEGASPALVDETVVVAAAEKARARFVWTGTYRRPEWKLEFFVRLWEVEDGQATIVGEAREHGDFSEVFTLLDDAIVTLLDKAGRPVPDGARARIARPATKDFYAFTLYGRGLHALVGLDGVADLPRAEKDLGRSVFIDPKFAEAHRMLAVVHGRLGQRGKARGQLSYALDLREDYYAPLSLLVREAYLARKRDEAIELAVRALALRPWDLEVRYMLGELLWEEGDPESARRELQRLTRVDPDHLPARRVLVLVHAAQGNMEDLASELEEILKLDPEDERARLDLGAAYHALGDDKRARAIYERIVAANPRHLQALKFLGDIHRAGGDVETAIAYYEKALAANRNDPRPYFLLGSAYLSAGEDDKALKIYHAAQRFPRYVAEAYSNLGAIYYRKGNNAEALLYLKSASQKKPQNPRIRYNYGLALSRARVRDRAVEEMTRAAELDPGEADFQFGLGVALLRVGRLEEAERAFQAALRLRPAHADAQHNLTLIDELRRRATEGEIQVE